MRPLHIVIAAHVLAFGITGCAYMINGENKYEFPLDTPRASDNVWPMTYTMGLELVIKGELKTPIAMEQYTSMEECEKAAQAINHNDDNILMRNKLLHLDARMDIHCHPDDPYPEGEV
jgi:hypothetical protein